jgi:hypothetical protein
MQPWVPNLYKKAQRMTDSTISSPTGIGPRFKQMLAYLLYPRQGAEQLVETGKPAWQVPMLVLSLSFALVTIVSGYLRAHAAALGQTSLPADWQWWTTDMQNNYMNAIQATQGPVFVYIIPLVTGLARLWLVWAIVSGLLHLSSTLFGGRGSMGMALNLVAYASLAFVVRDLFRLLFLMIARHPIVSPGLSGFSSLLFISKFMANVDLFLIWHAFLLVVGLIIADNLPAGKAMAAVFIVLLLLLLIQAGLGALSASLGGLMITRPF